MFCTGARGWLFEKCPVKLDPPTLIAYILAVVPFFQLEKI
jgi:hypothetical protein